MANDIKERARRELVRRKAAEELARRKNQPVGMGEDMERAGAAGVGRGFASLLGGFGDAAQMTGDATSWALGKLGAPDWAQSAGGTAAKYASGPLALLPGSDFYTSNISKATKPEGSESFIDYQPQTIVGDYTKTAGEFAPSALLGPGRMGAKIATGAAAAFGSETAGQFTKDSAAEPYARFAGAIIGGAAPLAKSAAGKVRLPLDIDPERSYLSNVLQKSGVDVTAGQATGDDALRYAESELGGRSASKIIDKQRGQFTKAVLGKIGVEFDRATPDIVNMAYKKIGSQFDELAGQYDIVADPKIADDLYKVVGSYQDLTSMGDQVDYVFNVGNRIYNTLAQSGGMTGGEYKAIREELSKNARATAKSETKGALLDLMSVLDDAMERNIASANPSDLGKWKEVRKKYRNFLVVEAASAAAGENAALGFISPQALQTAVKSKHGKRSYAQGNSDFAELSRAGAAVMREMPQSGTAPRTAARAMGQSVPTLLGAAVGGLAGLPGMVVGGLLGAASPHIMGRALMSKTVQDRLKRAANKKPKAVTRKDTTLVPRLGLFGLVPAQAYE